MNIFATSPDPKASAIALDDRRLVKMVLETAQLICTAVGHHGYDVPYRPTHTNHPCSVWARSSYANLKWLFDHGRALSIEYDRRYGAGRTSSHKSGEVIVSLAPVIEGLCAHAGKPRSFVNCARNERLGLDFTGLSDVHDAYRQYLNAKWREDYQAARWTNREPPYWYYR